MRNTVIVVVVGIIAWFVLPKAALVYFGLGLLVGWNVLEQPQWISKLYTTAKDWVMGKIG